MKSQIIMNLKIKRLKIFFHFGVQLISSFKLTPSPLNEFNGGNNFSIFDRLSATVGNFVILII